MTKQLNNLIKKVVILSGILFLTACGGGGSSSSGSSGNSQVATHCVFLSYNGPLAGFSNTCFDRSVNVKIFAGTFSGRSSFTLPPFPSSGIPTVITVRTLTRDLKFGACFSPSVPGDFNASAGKFNCS